MPRLTLLMTFLLFFAFGCSDDVTGDDSQGWNVGEPDGAECPGEDDFDAYFGPTECMDGDPPVGVCPEAEGYFSIHIDGCGCYCDYDPSVVEPPPEPIICPEDDDGEKYDPSLQPADCAPGGGVQCPDVEGSFGIQIDGCGCYCGYHPIDPPQCPDEDDGYHYVGHSPEECAAIDFTCENDQMTFLNECGCGCVDVDDSDCPGEDDGYDYVSDDLEECAVIFFTCDDDQEHFENECGCGCVDANTTDPTPAPGPTCGAWDAEGVGPCDEFLGVAYDGDQCLAHSGCNCVGSACHRLTDTLEDCQKQVRDCDYACGNPDGVICDVYMGIDPTSCPDGSAYTVVDCEPMCVNPNTCEKVDDSD